MHLPSLRFQGHSSIVSNARRLDFIFHRDATNVGSRCDKRGFPMPQTLYRDEKRTDCADTKNVSARRIENPAHLLQLKEGPVTTARKPELIKNRNNTPIQSESPRFYRRFATHSKVWRLMFSENMIAPCGLDCNVCIGRLRKESPCPGCRNTGEGKSEHCSKLCKIVFCEHRKQLTYGYCNSCNLFPCEHLLRMEAKYQNDYPLKDSLIGNLKQIKQYGMEKFLQWETEKWTCPDCGGIISIHTGKCADCDCLFIKKDKI